MWALRSSWFAYIGGRLTVEYKASNVRMERIAYRLQIYGVEKLLLVCNRSPPFFCFYLLYFVGSCWSLFFNPEAKHVFAARCKTPQCGSLAHGAGSASKRPEKWPERETIVTCRNKLVSPATLRDENDWWLHFITRLTRITFTSTEKQSKNTLKWILWNT